MRSPQGSIHHSVSFDAREPHPSSRIMPHVHVRTSRWMMACLAQGEVRISETDFKQTTQFDTSIKGFSMSRTPLTPCSVPCATLLPTLSLKLMTAETYMNAARMNLPLLATEFIDSSEQVNRQMRGGEVEKRARRGSVSSVQGIAADICPPILLASTQRLLGPALRRLSLR